MHVPKASFGYRLFGLNIASEIELPELVEVAPQGPADVVIRRGHAISQAGYTLSIEDVADFIISDGRLIEIDAAAGVAPRNVRLFLLGSAMGVLLHQRKLLPLHANAIVMGGRALAFTGPSGVGKSTLAAWCLDGGDQVLADDVCVLRSNGEKIEVLPGLPRLRLWRDALVRSGRRSADFELSFAGSFDSRDKFDVPIKSPSMTSQAVPLAAVVVLGVADEFRCDLLAGTDAVRALIENTYRGHLVNDVNNSLDHFDLCVAVARKTPVWRAVRPMDDSDYDDQARLLIQKVTGGWGLG